jgi:UDP-N-acetylglucosamine 4,6-dehydratase/5-epimerase
MKMFDNKNILVTGGTGSFGKKFISVILNKYNPNKVIVYSRDELKQFEMQNDETFKKYDDVLRYFIGDVRDLARLKRAFNGVDYVIHAAALKQVPAAEYNPFEAVKTNVYGAQNVIEASIDCGVNKVIALSTDKAAAPINLYGATKLTSDKLFVAANSYVSYKKTLFSVVRYGNVLGSRGSVVPFFQNQKSSGLLTITDNRMTRFNITLQQGVDFVINCFNRMWGGELFIPKIPSYNILDMAKAVSPDAEIKIVGIRPGEKVHEEMITETDSLNAIEFKDYFAILPTQKNWSAEDFIIKSSEKPGKRCEYGFSYNSKNNSVFLNISELEKLISNL